MSNSFKFKPSGVCSREMQITVDDNNKIESLTIIGGCPGNTFGISQLVVGMDLNDVADKLIGTDCHSRGTSCPDQLARGIKKYLEENQVTSSN